MFDITGLEIISSSFTRLYMDGFSSSENYKQIWGFLLNCDQQKRILTYSISILVALNDAFSSPAFRCIQ